MRDSQFLTLLDYRLFQMRDVFKVTPRFSSVGYLLQLQAAVQGTGKRATR